MPVISKVSFIPAGMLLLMVAGCQPESPVEDDQPSVERAVADRVFLNGKVLTADIDFSIAQAIAVSDDRIVAVGSDAQVNTLVGDTTEVVDLNGRTIVPGLIDNHMHFVRATRNWYREVRWDGIRSREQALQMVAERSGILPAGEWTIVIGGWNFSQFADDSSDFTRGELDLLFPDAPVYIQQNYQRGFANSAALAAAGITANTVYSGSGQMVRDANGEPTGEFIGGQAMAFITQHMPEVTAAKWDASLQQSIEDMNRMGLTTVYDVGGNTVTPEFYDAVHRAHDNDSLDMRVFYTINDRNQDLSTPEKIIDVLSSNAPDNEALSVAQFGYGESIYRPIRATPFVVSDEDWDHLYDIAITAVENGWQMNEHSSRDIKIQAMLDVFERVNETHPITDLRWTIAHNNTTSPDSVRRGMELGMMFAVHASRRNASAAQMERGGEAALHQPPIRMIHESGAIWGLGSDATIVASPNPFHTLGWAVSGRSNGGDVTLVETVPRADALVAHTRSNAYHLFREDHLGSLEAGKLADFVVLNRDYMTVPAEDIENLYSVMTVVGGEIVYQE